METLAIIAYRQPVTRGDIEDIRGVGGVDADHPVAGERAAGSTSSATARRPAGRHFTPPPTKFLDDLGLRSLEELPPLEEIAKTLQLEVPPAQPEPEAEAAVREEEPQQHRATGTDG